MISKKLNIIPVRLEPPGDSVENTIAHQHEEVCFIKTMDIEITLFTGVEVDVVQAIMRELNIREA